jgi:hypothetical protein
MTQHATLRYQSSPLANLILQGRDHSLSSPLPLSTLLAVGLIPAIPSRHAKAEKIPDFFRGTSGSFFINTAKTT